MHGWDCRLCFGPHWARDCPDAGPRLVRASMGIADAPVPPPTAPTAVVRQQHVASLVANLIADILTFLPRLLAEVLILLRRRVLE